MILWMTHRFIRYLLRLFVSVLFANVNASLRNIWQFHRRANRKKIVLFSFCALANSWSPRKLFSLKIKKKKNVASPTLCFAAVVVNCPLSAIHVKSFFYSRTTKNKVLNNARCNGQLTIVTSPFPNFFSIYVIKK